MDESSVETWVTTSAFSIVDVFERVMEAHAGSFAEREQAALSLANEVVRRWMESELRRMAIPCDTRTKSALMVNAIEGTRVARFATTHCADRWR